MIKSLVCAIRSLNNFSYKILFFGSIFCFLLTCVGVYFTFLAAEHGLFPYGVLAYQTAETASLLLFHFFLYAVFSQVFYDRFKK